MQFAQAFLKTLEQYDNDAEFQILTKYPFTAAYVFEAFNQFSSNQVQFEDMLRAMKQFVKRDAERNGGRRLDLVACGTFFASLPWDRPVFHD